MNTLAAFRSAWRALTANPLRSMLTMLGIIIGVGAVITMIAIGSGAQQRIEDEIKALGSNLMMVRPGSVTQGGVRLGSQSGQALTEDDGKAIAAEIPAVQAVAPSMRIGMQVVAGNANWATNIQGSSADYLEVRDWRLADGRNFEPAEEAGAAKVALLGATVARELYGDADPINQSVRVRGVPLTVIGVLASKGENSAGDDQDDLIVVPISTFRHRIQGWGGGRIKRVWSLTVKLREGESMEATAEEIQALLRQRHRRQPGQEDDVTVRSLTETLEAEEASSRVMSLLLAAVAGVSLLVGGIGIMNIMLVSVTERTREIGLRMAVGARGRDILAQFLIEAMTLSLLGGAIGVVLGAAATYGVAALADWHVVLSAQAIVLAVGFSAAVGIFFGYYPARRAAALLPIQALRYE